MKLSRNLIREEIKSVLSEILNEEAGASAENIGIVKNVVKSNIDILKRVVMKNLDVINEWLEKNGEEFIEEEHVNQLFSKDAWLTAVAKAMISSETSKEKDYDYFIDWGDVITNACLMYTNIRDRSLELPPTVSKIADGKPFAEVIGIRKHNYAERNPQEYDRMRERYGMKRW